MITKNKEHTFDHLEETRSFADHYIDVQSRVEHGLGSKAVKARLNDADYKIEEMNDGWYADFTKDILESSLQDARARLEELSPEKVSYADHFLRGVYLGKSVNPRGVNALLGLEDGYGPREYIAKLTERDNDGNYTVGDETLANFLEWHNFNLARGQQEVEKKSDKLKKKFKNKVKRSIKKGWAPEWLEDRLGERLAETQVVGDDGFLTLLDGAAGKAYRNGSEDRVVMEPDKYHSRFYTGGDTLTHEFVHAIDGYEGRERGMYRFFGSYNREPGRALNEAVVEHYAYSIHYNVPIDDTDPHSAKRDKSTYVKERMLLDTLCNMGKKPIDIRLFIAAHFHHEESDLYQSKNPIDLLQAELEEAFPFGIVDIMEHRLKHENDLADFLTDLRGWIGKPVQTDKEIAHRNRANQNKLDRYNKIGAVAASALIAGGIPIASISATEHVANNPKNTVVQEGSSSVQELIFDQSFSDVNRTQQGVYPATLGYDPSMYNSPELIRSQGGIIEGNSYYFPQNEQTSSLIFNYDQTPDGLVMRPLESAIDVHSNTLISPNGQVE